MQRRKRKGYSPHRMEGQKISFCFISIVVLLGCMFAIMERDMVAYNQPGLSKLGVIDAFIYLWKGQTRINMDEDLLSQMPMLWMLLQTILLFTIASFTYSQMRGAYIKQIMLIGRKEYSNIVCKRIVVTTAICFSICIVIAWICCKQVNGYHLDILSMVMGLELNQKVSLEVIYALFCMPMLASITIVMLQWCLSIVIGETFAFMIVEAYLFVGIFVIHPLMIGNSGMIARNRLFLEGGVSNMSGTIINLVSILISILVGKRAFYRKNILTK